MQLLRAILLMLLLIAPVAAQKDRDWVSRWDAPRSDAEIIEAAQARRITRLEERLTAIEDKSAVSREEWVVIKLKLDQLFYVISAVGGFVALAIGGLALDWVRKRLRVGQ